MHGAILAAQILKIIAGLAQLGFAVLLLFRAPRSATNTAFTISFGANGLAYLLWNLAMPGQRTAGSLALEGRAVFNWIATVAMLAFAVLFVRGVQRLRLAVIAAIGVAATVLVADAASGARLSFMQFGGIAIYPATAFALGMFPVAFATDSPAVRRLAAWLGAALAINSVDHLGAEIVQPSPTSETAVVLQLAAMATVLIMWVWAGAMSDAPHRPLGSLVAACMVLPFLGGVLVREAAGSYLGVQRSGFIGVGRLVATGLLIYGMQRREIFSSQRSQAQSSSVY